MTRLHRLTPTPVTGYELSSSRGYFSVVVPEATENLVTNPSFETGIDGWLDLSAGTREQSPDYQAVGAYSLKYTPDANTQAGVYFTLTTLDSDTSYTLSAYVRGAPGVPYRLYFYDNGNAVVLGEVKFRGDGRWHRYHATGATSNTGSHWCVVRKDDSASVAPFYVDGVQLEAKDHPTTYCDGDMVGLVPSRTTPFYWLGARHASRSVRTAWTAAGGRVRRLDEVGFHVSSYIGAGLPPAQNVTSPNALIGGATYQRTVPQSRPLTIGGHLSGSNPQHLQRQRRDLYNLFQTPVVQQPILLRYQLFDDCGAEAGSEIELPVLYGSGLEQVANNNYWEDVSVQLLSTEPHWRSVLETAATSTDLIVNVPDGDYIAMRDPTRKFDSFLPPVERIWTRVSEGFDNVVRTLAWGPDGKLYAGGDFINADNGSPIPVNYIAVYDPSLGEWNDLDTGLNGLVRSIAFDALGNLYVGGDFTEAGAGATVVDRVAMWDGAAWNALGGTPGVGGGVVYAVAVASDNSVYVGGTFTTAGGAAAERLAKWDGSAWAPVFASPSGPNAIVRTIQIDTDGNDDVYFAGDFTTVDGASINRVAKYVQATGGAVALGAGLSDSCYVLMLRPDGSLFAGGTFVQAGGNNVGPTGTDDGKIAVWNGSAWSSVGGGLGTGDVDAIGYDPLSGNVYFGGDFTTYFQNFRAPGVTLVDHFVGWNGVGFFQPDVNLPTSAQVKAILGRITGELAVGHNGTGNIICTSLLFATNNGSTDAYPKIVMSGEGAVYQIENLTTGQAIYFNNLTIADGETVTLDLVRKTMYSTTRGNLLSKITPGSDLATWRLAPGENVLSLYLPNATASVSLIWRDGYSSVDGAVL